MRHASNGLMLGPEQVVQETAVALENMGACVSGCWLWPSITQRSYQTAEILAAVLDVSRSRIVPEYSFLDARCALGPMLTAAALIIS